MISPPAPQVALDETEVDLKRLTARIGCGKKYLRMAAEDLLQPVLGVAPGCVTPLALACAAGNPKLVGLLLDYGDDDGLGGQS